MLVSEIASFVFPRVSVQAMRFDRKPDSLFLSRDKLIRKVDLRIMVVIAGSSQSFLIQSYNL